MAANIDIGEAHDIHPKNKQEVARRLAVISLADTYGQKIPAQAPVYDDYTDVYKRQVTGYLSSCKVMTVSSTPGCTFLDVCDTYLSSDDGLASLWCTSMAGSKSVSYTHLVPSGGWARH